MINMVILQRKKLRRLITLRTGLGAKNHRIVTVRISIRNVWPATCTGCCRFAAIDPDHSLPSGRSRKCREI